MDRVIKCGIRSGAVTPPVSKSYLHRALICASLSGKKKKIFAGTVSKDIKVTADCLNAFLADITYKSGYFYIIKKEKIIKDNVVLNLSESGTTLRFLLPLCAALGVNAKFILSESLLKRPIEPLINQLSLHGINYIAENNEINISGKLLNGEYEIKGDISSQFISGLLLSLPILKGDSTLSVIGKPQSAPYIEITEHVLNQSKIKFIKTDNKYKIFGNQKYNLPDNFVCENDYSAAAPFLCMGAFSENGIRINSLNFNSVQGDKEIIKILKSLGAVIKMQENSVFIKKSKFKKFKIIDASDIPDIIPVLSVLLSGIKGVFIIKNAGRLRFKETDRIKNTVSLINDLGGKAKEFKDSFIIMGKSYLKGGKANSYGDHRIAMAAAVAATFSKNDITVLNTESMDKSYPDFWKDFNSLEV